MAKKRSVSIAGTLGEAVSDVANAASVAATGSEIGMLELAAEDELKPVRGKRPRKVKVVPKKTSVAKRSRKVTRKKAKRKAKRESR